MNYILRMAKFADLEALVKLNYMLDGYRWNEEKFTELFNHDVPIILACDKYTGELIGFLAFILVLDELRILNIVVHPTCRNQKIARTLIYAAVNYALEHNCRYALLEVNVSNSIALNLYKKLGFTILCVRYEYYEDFTDAYFMEIVLSKMSVPPVYVTRTFQT